MFSNGYTYRRLITIPPEKISGNTNLSEFRAFVEVHGEYLKSEANGGQIIYNDNFLDIRFETLDGTKLKHEIVHSPTEDGQFRGWVLLPTVNATFNTQFYMYYRKSLTSSDQERQATWGASYFRGMYHMAENTIFDSTGVLSGNVTINGAVSSDDSPMKSGYLFDGVNDYISLGNYWNYTRPLCGSFWIKVLDGGSSLNVWSNDESSTNYYGVNVRVNSDMSMYILVGSGGTPGPTARNNANTPANVIQEGVWHKVDWEVAGYNDMKIFVDGVNQELTYGGSYTGNPVTSSSPAVIGRKGTSEYFNGHIAEMRMFNQNTTLKSADFLRTEYINQFQPMGFIIVSNTVEYSLSDSIEVDEDTVIAQKVAIFVETLRLGLVLGRVTRKYIEDTIKIDHFSKLFGTLHQVVLFDSIGIINRASRLLNGKLAAWSKRAAKMQIDWSKKPRRKW